MSFDLVIKNGTIVTAETTYQADIGIEGQKIAAIGRGLPGEREIDAAGKLVTPGAIDGHVHLEMPIGNFVSADDFFSGTRAAAFGGTTTIIDFVEARPGESLLAALAARRANAADKAVIDYGLHMTITPSDMTKLKQLPGVVEAGCRSFKLYMAYAMRLHDGQLLQALEAIRDAGGLPVVHAENWDAICALVDGNLRQGNIEPRWHPRSRPPSLEGEAAGRLIDLAAYVGLPVHIFHVSCAEVVARIAAAQARGLPVYAETCPQYLLLADDVYDRPGLEGALPVCSPPLRGKHDQERLWQALAQNTINLISTDHCPFTRADKATGLNDFSHIPGGLPSIEARFSLIYDRGVRAGRLSANRWVEVCCTQPARLFGLKNKGHIAVGYDADLVVFDSDCGVVVDDLLLHEKADWTPYEGIHLQGWPSITISRGEVIVKDGQFLGQAGRGQFLKRSA